MFGRPIQIHHSISTHCRPTIRRQPPQALALTPGLPCSQDAVRGNFYCRATGLRSVLVSPSTRHRENTRAEIERLGGPPAYLAASFPVQIGRRCITLYKLRQSVLDGVFIRLTWISVSLATRKHLLTQSTRVPFIISLLFTGTMDYDAYDALLHHIFRQVSTPHCSYTSM